MVIDVVGVKEDATHIRYEPSGGTPLFAVRTDTAGGRGIAPDRALMVLVADLPAGLRPHGWTPTGGWMTREEADDRAAVLRGEKDGAK